MKSLLSRCLLPLGLALAAGCQFPEEPPRPAKLLTKDEMATLLVQLHLLESRTETTRLSPDSARSLFLSQQRALFQQHHLNPADSTFERSYRYYAIHNKDLSDIYKVVVDSLQAQARRLGSTGAPPYHHP